MPFMGMASSLMKGKSLMRALGNIHLQMEHTTSTLLRGVLINSQRLKTKISSPEFQLSKTETKSSSTKISSVQPRDLFIEMR